MNVDRALVRSKRAIMFLVISFTGCSHLYRLLWYSTITQERKWRKINSKAAKKTCEKRRQSIERAEREEDTTMVVYPQYQLESPLLKLQSC